ncbi:hypothetical protein CSUI_002621 [Cystoisospora suis]|uniref:Uncharacterized protein n=1 Tax=Cystoisospora suis TaxID=483139 RepID=A0A2C6KTA6_9APIC|nr:hypothetical protein CSUI_002621 [Cystoisospora suis]
MGGAPRRPGVTHHQSLHLPRLRQRSANCFSDCPDGDRMDPQTLSLIFCEQTLLCQRCSACPLLGHRLVADACRLLASYPGGMTRTEVLRALGCGLAYSPGYCLPLPQSNPLSRSLLAGMPRSCVRPARAKEAGASPEARP